ncbi:unnamed protein product [Rotaria socialis]|uniref:Uncharacterized protein n=2 Tax=Rotaria socialis TaxID=392032 RepID=A0A817U672_9BILA|nr:unnamed protein product [Rotaria socialis]CAF3184794.1 unnamed protein product [Rotaria socialis]CAF3315668.1 unnamed protein product [Rotaria socialis]CAF3327151.1 unnamed protein product [Rotaria socialis]CAF3474341.1 unnamed protein product [Rotaria socialis]
MSKLTIKIATPDPDGNLCLDINPNEKLSVTRLISIFPRIGGLKYKNQTTDEWMLVPVVDGYFEPFENWYSDVVYFPVYPVVPGAAAPTTTTITTPTTPSIQQSTCFMEKVDWAPVMASVSTTALINLIIDVIRWALASSDPL